MKAEEIRNPAPGSFTNQLLVALIFMGFAARIGLLWVSIGSVDAYLWEHLGSQIARLGLYDTYRFEHWMNHPPLPGLFAGLVSRIAGKTGWSFPFLFKIPQIMADVGTCALVYAIYRSRATVNPIRAGLVAAAVFAWNLDAILLSGFHCNTDPSYSLLCVLSIWLADTKCRPLLAGLTLGVALNIKLLPGLFLVPMLLLSRSWREFFKITIGLAVMSMPYIYVLLDPAIRFRFRQRVLQYRPLGGSAPMDILLSLNEHPLLKKYTREVIDRYRDAGKALVLLSSILPTLMMRRNGQFNRYRAAAMAAVIFPVVSPGFAIHYTAMVGAVLLAYDLRAGAWWGFLTGLQLLSFYVVLWNGDFPIAAQTPLGPGGPAKYFEMLVWGFSLLWLIREFRSIAAARPPVSA